MNPDPKFMEFPAAGAYFDAVCWLGLISLCCFLPWLLTFALGMRRKP